MRHRETPADGLLYEAERCLQRTPVRDTAAEVYAGFPFAKCS